MDSSGGITTAGTARILNGTNSDNGFIGSEDTVVYG